MKQINIKEYFKQEVEKLRADRSVVPSLMIIDATTQDPANQIYIRNKIKDFDALDWKAEVFRTSTTDELKKLLGGVQKREFNSVIVQMPVMLNIEFSYDMISPLVDADGLNPMSNITPATVRGIIDYLDDCGFNYSGKSALILGRSDIVGKPMAKILLDKDMTISMCHSKTDINTKLYLARQADLVISAVGNFTLTREACPHAIVIDVGIRRNEAGTILGDFIEIDEIAERNNVWSTPVPGGVGLLTRLGLMKNCLQLAKQAQR